MKVKLITTKKNYKAYLKVVAELLEMKVKPGTPEWEKLETARELIRIYEENK